MADSKAQFFLFTSVVQEESVFLLAFKIFTKEQASIYFIQVVIICLKLCCINKY